MHSLKCVQTHENQCHYNGQCVCKYLWDIKDNEVCSAMLGELENSAFSKKDGQSCRMLYCLFFCDVMGKIVSKWSAAKEILINMDWKKIKRERRKDSRACVRQDE